MSIYNRSTTPVKKPARRAPVARGLIAGAAVVVCSLVAWHFLWSDAEPERPEAQEPARKAPVDVKARPSRPTPRPDKEGTAARTAKRTGTRAATNRYERISDTTYRMIKPNGETMTVVRPPRSGKKPMFATKFENHLRNYSVPGRPPTPMPYDFDDAEVRAILKQPINVDMNNDTDEEIAEKQSVMMLKEEIQGLMDAGKTANESIREIEARQAKEAVAVQESKRLIAESIRSGDIEGAKQLYDRINEHLAKKGIPPVVLSRNQRVTLGLTDWDTIRKEDAARKAAKEALQTTKEGTGK